MLGLPIYLLGSTYYLHTRIEGRQVKRSLRTGYEREAIIRAIALLNGLRMSTPQKYELDLANGILKADGAEDHSRLMQAIEAMKALHSGMPTPASVSTVTAPAVDDPTALKLGELLERFFLLRSVKPATALSYKNATNEFAKFLKNPPITRISTSDVTRWQEHLAKKGNVPRTIDGKVGVIKAIYNFAKKQRYTREENPAADRDLLTKKQKQRAGYATFDTDEIAAMLGCEFFRDRLAKKSDYTTAVLVGLLTACRVGEITVLRKEHFKHGRKGIPFITIRDSKTAAGIREVPLHPYIYEYLAPKLDALKSPGDRLFSYKEREGKGAGNAAGKMLAHNLESAGLTRDKLVFHSLRKYVNNELLQNGVNLEHRCQFVGHELDNVNVVVYSKTISVDDLAAQVFPALDTIAATVQKAIDPMGSIDIGDLIDPDMLM
ncbi:MAG: tyrosine-type recombinase/integrase [Pseudomonadota bacterium]